MQMAQVGLQIKQAGINNQLKDEEFRLKEQNLALREQQIEVNRQTLQVQQQQAETAAGRLGLAEEQRAADEQLGIAQLRAEHMKAENDLLAEKIKNMRTGSGLTPGQVQRRNDRIRQRAGDQAIIRAQAQKDEEVLPGVTRFSGISESALIQQVRNLNTRIAATEQRVTQLRAVGGAGASTMLPAFQRELDTATEERGAIQQYLTSLQRVRFEAEQDPDEVRTAANRLALTEPALDAALSGTVTPDPVATVRDLVRPEILDTGINVDVQLNNAVLRLFSGDDSQVEEGLDLLDNLLMPATDANEQRAQMSLLIDHVLGTLGQEELPEAGTTLLRRFAERRGYLTRDTK